ncbi:glycolate oxidase FAD binding subunit [Cognatiyoonia koreensis]|uniref:Glycolate oxidase FAD binding subunit n=1 Tax=Cognatiyoonia koreensis TaxID=364200 RepID=A0A1I0QTQ2_9RHOB|nr:FAD-binding protein [Cognatiyoonia koreensis]SEW30998.1 glycolate oxidase FAD binding subunit [Cognatiyoonia koreensis]
MTPKDETALAEAIRDAKGPLRITGGGTRPYGRPVVGEALSVSKLSGINLYDPGALTIVVQAGTPIKTIEAALKKENQRLPFEPMDHRALLASKGEPTIGGVVAGNISGPRRISVGACRDFLLGVRFVDGAGNVVKNGGRVMKNVTGYDLVKLMCGAHGTLGVLTEVALKVLPDVACASTVVIEGLDDARAVAAMSAALGSPYEVSGAAYDPINGQTMLRLEGFANSVAYRAESLGRVLEPFGQTSVVEGKDSAALWTAMRDVTAFADRVGDVWRISVKPTDAAALFAHLGVDAAQYDWGGGLIWALVPEGSDLRSRIGDVKGHATLIRASEATRAAIASFHPETPAVGAISKGLRDKFDPRGILNPGLMT